LATPQQAARL